MPSTYSPLKIQLMATGENNTTWGDVTNLNLGTAIEEAIVGSADVTFASGDVTLTLTDTNASQTARNMRLRCTGTTGGSPRNLVVPSIEKPYIVKNDCADSVTVKTAAGTGIAVPAGKTMWVYSDGTNVVDAVTHLSSLTLGTDLSVADGGTGASTFTANGLLYGNGASALQVTAAGTTGQVLVGNTGSAPSWATLTSTAVTSISFGSTGLTPSTATQGAVTVAGTLGVANGGTGTATQFTAGSVVFAGASGVYSQSNANLFWDNGNARLGIGTASPTEKLDVNGVIKGGVAAGVTLLMADSSAIRNTASAGNTMYFDSGVGAGSTTGDFQFRSTASYTTRFYINGNTGNVGVGTTSPARLLEVTASGTNIPARLGNSQGNLDIGGSDGVTVNIDTRSWAMALQTGGTERMRITTAGLVGIGTSSPGAKLDTRGSNITVGSNDALVQFRTTTAQAADVGASLQLGGMYDGSNSLGFAEVAGRKENSTSGDWSGYMQFSTRRFGGAFAERMRITSDGNVGIGTTANWAKLQVSNAGAEQLEFAPAVAANVNRILSYNRNTNAYNTMRLDGADYQFYVSGSERVRIDSSGNVLIGTSSSPSVSRLYVDSTEARIQSRNSTSGANGYIGAMNPNEWRGAWAITGTPVTFGTSDVERMRITSDGNVGIGTSAPASLLHAKLGSNATEVYPTGTWAGRIINAVDAVANNGLVVGNRWAATNSFVVDFGSIYGNNSGSWSSYYKIDGVGQHFWGSGAAGTERMRIDSSGNVGIGTSVPDVKVSIQDAGAGQITLKDSGGTTRAYIMTNGAIGTAPTNSLRIRGDSGVALGAVGSLAMFIDTSNNVGVGTSSPGTGTRLNVAGRGLFTGGSYDPGDGTASGVSISYDTGSNVGIIGAVQTGVTERELRMRGNTLTFFTNGANERMRIDSSGSVVIGATSAAGARFNVTTAGAEDVIYVDANTAGAAGTAVYVLPIRTAATFRGGVRWNGTSVEYNTTSDIRLKENITDADDASALIDAIQVRKFDWKETGFHQRYGFVAQELVEVAPEAVSASSDPEEMMGVDYSKLVPMLVKEIQSLRARVAQLEGN